MQPQQQAKTEGERRAAIKAYRVVYWRNVFKAAYYERLLDVEYIDKIWELKQCNDFILQQIKDLQK